MSHQNHVGIAGIRPAQHHDEKWEQEVRIVEWSARIIGRDEYGNYIYGEDSVGDEICRFLWERDSRKTSGWSNAWPVVIGGGAGGGGNGDGAGGTQAGFSFSGVRTNFSAGTANINNFADVRQNFSSGSADIGVDTGLLNATTPRERTSQNAAAAGTAEPTGDRRRDVATGGGPEAKGCSGCDGGAGGMFPVYDSGWAPDLRFKAKEVNAPPGYPKPHGGGYGIAMAGTHEWKQEELFFQIDPRLIAVNHDGSPKMATTVHDMKGCDIDGDRYAPLQSMMWVLKDVLGGDTIAWNIGDSGCGDTFGGAVIDRPAPGGGGGTQVAAGGGERAVAFVSMHDGGFVDVGSGRCKHVKGKDKDGHPVGGAHITTKANFRRNDLEDGPLRFELYEEGDEHDSEVMVKMGWSGADWAWWTTTPFHWIIPDLQPIRPLRPNTSTPGTNVNPRPGVPTGGSFGGGFLEGVTGAEPLQPANPAGGGTIVNPPAGTEQSGPDGDSPFPALSPATIWGAAEAARPLLGTFSEVGTPGILALPTTSFTGATEDVRNKPGSKPADLRNKLDQSTPVTGQMAAFSGEGGSLAGAGGYAENTGASGDPHVYTQRPGESKYAGGTGPGGWVILPPEVGLEDWRNGYVPTTGDVSTTYMMVGPGAWFGAGVPELSNGALSTGYSWGRDTATGDLLFRSHPASTVPDNAVKFTWSGQDIAWRSETDYWGTITHGITADRTWTFPDASGTVILGSGTAGQVAYWSTTSSLSGDAGFTYDATTDQLLLLGTGASAGLRIAYDGTNYCDLRVASNNSFQIIPSTAGGLAHASLVFNKNASAVVAIAQQNAGASAGLALTLSGSGGGDTYIAMNRGATTYYFGVDTSDADAFKLSQTSLGFTDLWRTDGTGTAFFGWVRVGTATDAAAAGDWCAGLTGANRIFYDQSTHQLQILGGTNPRVIVDPGSNTAAQITFDAATTITSATFETRFYRLTNTTGALGLYGYVGDGSGNVAWQIADNAAAVSTVFNEQGADIDFRVEGDTVTHLLHVDAGFECVAVGCSGASGWKFMIQGTTPVAGISGDTTNQTLEFRFNDNAFTTIKGRLLYAGANGAGSQYFGLTNTSADYLSLASNTHRFWNAGFTVEYASTSTTAWTHNEGGADYDFRVEGDTDTHNLFVDASVDTVLMGKAARSFNSKLEVQKSITDPSASSMAMAFSAVTSITSAGAQAIIGCYVDTQTIDVATGITQSNLEGYRAAMLRARATDLGTISATYAYRALHGHFTGLGATASTTTAFGMYLGQFAMVGSIGTLYGVAVNGDGTGGTVTTSIAFNANPVSSTVSAANTYAFFSVKGSINCTAEAGQSFVWNESGVDADFRVEGDTDTQLLLVDAGLDAVAIGSAASADEKLSVQRNTTATSGVLYGIHSQFSHTPSGLSTANNISIRAQHTIVGPETTGTAQGLLAQVAGTAPLSSSAYAVYSSVSNTGAVTWTAARCFYAETNVGHASGVITSAFGLQVAAPTVTGAITTFEGIRIEDPSAAGITTKYAIRTLGGTTILNENGGDYDFRVEGDNLTSCFLVDASDDEVAIDGRFSLIDRTPAQLTGNQNDYVGPEGTAANRSTVWRLSSDASRNITGIAGGLQGRNLRLINVGSNNIVIQDQNVGSVAANRIITGTGADITLAADDTMELWYDSTTARWRVL